MHNDLVLLRFILGFTDFQEIFVGAFIIIQRKTKDSFLDSSDLCIDFVLANIQTREK